MTDFPERKRMRLSGFDYNECYRVFLTICVKDRRCLLARIVGTGVPDGPHCVPQSEARVELKRAGKIADEVIRKMNSFYEYVSVDEYVIMPNHIHFLLSFYPEGDSCSEDGPSGGAMGAPRSGRSDLSEWQRSAEGEEACRRRQMLGTATGPSSPTYTHKF